MELSQPHPAVKRFVSASGAARRLGIANRTLLKRVEAGVITPDAYTGRTILIEVARLDSLRRFFKPSHTIA